MDDCTSIGKAFSILKFAPEEELQNFIADIKVVVHRFTKLSLVDRSCLNGLDKSGYGHTPEDSGPDDNGFAAENESTTSSFTDRTSPAPFVPPATPSSAGSAAEDGMLSIPLTSPAPPANDGALSAPPATPPCDRATVGGGLDVTDNSPRTACSEPLQLEDAPKDVQKLISSVRKMRGNILAHMERSISDSVMGNRHWTMADRRILDIEFAEGKRDKTPQGQFRRVLATLSLTQQFLAWQQPRARLARPQRSVKAFSAQYHFDSRTTVENAVARGRKLLCIANQARLPSISTVSAFTWTTYRNINESNISSLLKHLEAQEPVLCQTLRDRMQWFTQCQELYESHSQSKTQPAARLLQGSQTLDILAEAAMSDATANMDDLRNPQAENVSELHAQHAQQTLPPAPTHNMHLQSNDPADEPPRTTDYSGVLQNFNSQYATGTFSQSYAMQYPAETTNAGNVGQDSLLQPQRNTAAQSIICYLNEDIDLWDVWQPEFSATGT